MSMGATNTKKDSELISDFLWCPKSISYCHCHNFDKTRHFPVLHLISEVQSVKSLTQSTEITQLHKHVLIVTFSIFHYHALSKTSKVFLIILVIFQDFVYTSAASDELHVCLV